MSRGRIPDEAIEGIRACLVDKKNPDKCIDKVLVDNGLTEDDKARVLEKIAKQELE